MDTPTRSRAWPQSGPVTARRRAQAYLLAVLVATLALVLTRPAAGQSSTPPFTLLSFVSANDKLVPGPAEAELYTEADGSTYALLWDGPAKSQASTYQGVSTATEGEVRWGPQFRTTVSHHIARHNMRPMLGPDAEFLVFPRPTQRRGFAMILEYTSTAFALLEWYATYSYPNGGTGQVLKGFLNIFTLDVTLLVAVEKGPAWDIFWVEVTEGMPGTFESLLFTTHVKPTADLFVEVPTGGAIYVPLLDSLDTYQRMSKPGPVSRSTYAWGAPLQQVVLTRLVPPANLSCQGGDMVALTVLGQIEVKTCFTSLWSNPRYTTKLPLGAASTGRLIAAPLVDSSTVEPHFYYLADASTAMPATLWRVRFHAGGSFTWTQVRLPGSGWDLAKTQLLLLPVTGSPSKRWTLVIGGRAYYDPADFLCGVDATIACPGEPGWWASPTGWVCKPRSIMAPMVASRSLCFGCHAGYYADTRDRCSVCAGDLLLEVKQGPYAGPASCVAACSPGYVQEGRLCVKSQARLPSGALGMDMSLGAYAPRVSGSSTPVRVVGMAATHLLLNSQSRLMLRPESRLNPDLPREGALLLTDTGEVLLSTLSNLSAASPAPMARVASLSGRSMEPRLRELGPFPGLRYSDEQLAIVSCGSRISVVFVTCSFPAFGSPTPCTVSDATVVDLGPGMEITKCYDMHSASSTMEILIPIATSTSGRHVVRLRKDVSTMEILIPIATSTSGRHVVRLRKVGSQAAFEHHIVRDVHAVADLPGLSMVLTLDSFKTVALYKKDLAANDPRTELLAQQDISFSGYWHSVFRVPVVREADSTVLRYDTVFSGTEYGSWVVAMATKGGMYLTGKLLDATRPRQVLGKPYLQPVNERCLLAELVTSDPEFPAALVLLSDRVLGMAVVQCLPNSQNQCHLLPAFFHEDPYRELGLAQMQDVVMHAADLRAGHFATLLAVNQAGDVQRVAFKADCPARTFGIWCKPCHGSCLGGCTGPTSADCVV
ncbi:hypothetical protein H696_06127 [Fonticula alba]|uniref:Uncharacterized protein n=1 Tax=Fonticula alba TaxID=691883 RepID=A0A058YZN0_FONAL|nr:hypothetical protein H696_06127 [Fonticula alba]KCV67434.1 hypothetical protein H696_06127 [Fonticula alba]|eukprot:XP_009498161.1 hypothetical protein H696_06127 [Fonticula alba]